MLWDVGSAERREFFFNRLLSETDAAKKVRLFGIGAFLRGRMLEHRRTANSARRAVDLREVRVGVVLALLAASVSGGGLLWAIATVRSGELSVGGFTMFVAAVGGVQGSLATLAAQLAQTQNMLLLLDHYTAVTSAGSDLAVAQCPRPVPVLSKGIELRDVWFRYSDDHAWVLRGVDLFLPHGKSLALVGLNGAGKSTLIKLLCRFYDPTSGTILWDGVDIRHVDAAELRSRISAAFQDYMHYDMTAAENIGLGDVEALGDPVRIETSASAAGVHEDLSRLPRGYDTMLSRTFFAEADKEDPETGVMLSGGQWQRLAIARALLRGRRDLMILDEPSSGLDAESEHAIHAALRRHREGRTSLLISHRLGVVRDADLIAVLSAGRVIELGDHGMLMEAGGEYARLFALQASGYQEWANSGPSFTEEP
jgi:ATP-binding cassette subfamily B protein